MTESRPRMRPLWPLGPWPYAVVAVLVLGIVLSETSARWGLPYQDWTATSSAFMLQLAIAGPVSAAAAAYVAWRLCARDRVFARRPGARPTRQVLGRHLALLMTACVGAYVVGLVPLFVLTVRDATAGGPDAGLVVSGLVGLATYVVLGYAAGAGLGSFLAVPAAFVVGLAITVAGTSYTTALSPVLPAAVELGQRPATPLLLLRLVVLMLVVAALLLLAESSLGVPRTVPVAAVAMLVVAGAFVVVAARDQPPARVDQADPPEVCSTLDETSLCLHEGHRDQLAEVRAGVRRTLTAYGAQPVRVWDEALRGAARPGTPYLWVSVDPTYTDESDLVAQDLAGQLISPEKCVRRYGYQLPQDVSDLYTYLQTWVSQGGKVDAGYDYPHLRTLDRAGTQRWLRQHRAELDACTVDLDRLPA